MTKRITRPRPFKICDGAVTLAETDERRDGSRAIWMSCGITVAEARAMAAWLHRAADWAEEMEPMPQDPTDNAR